MEITPQKIFRKTKSGDEALLSRGGNIPFILRRTLIIVDGIADVAALHDKAPLYDDIEESLGKLVEQGYIVPADQPTQQAQVKAKIVPPVSRPAPTAQDKSTISTKQRLVHLLEVDLNEKGSHCDQATLNKLLARITSCDDNKTALSEAWTRCIKIIKLTINDEIASILKSSGEQYLNNYTKS